MKRLIWITVLLFCCGVDAVAEERDVISEIKIRGNERVSEETIRDQLSTLVGKKLDKAAIDADIKQIYKTGFFEKVVAGLRVRGQDGVLTFSVVERPALRQVFLKGNEELSEEVLKEKLEISAARFLDKKKIKAGIEQLKLYYQSLGFYDTSIDYSITSVENNQVDLTFVVDEGEKKKLRKIFFEGNDEITDSELKGVVMTRKYKWWSSWLTGSGVVKADQLTNDVQLISRYYLTKGYADVRVGEPEIKEVDDGLVLTFKIEEGPIFSLRNIGVKGDLVNGDTEKTLEGVQVKRGDTFNIDTIRQSTFHILDKFTDVGYAFANVEPATSLDRTSREVDVVFEISRGKLAYVDRINISGNSKTTDNVIRRSLKIQETDLFSSSKIRRSQELLNRLGFFEEVSITPQPSKEKERVDLLLAVREAATGTFSAGAGISSDEGFIFNVRVSENNLFGQGNSIVTDVNVGTINENYVFSFTNPRINDSYWSGGIDLLSTEREFDDFDRKQRGGSLTAGYPLMFFGPENVDDVRFSLRYELLEIDIDNISEDAPELIQNEKGVSTSSSITPRLVRNTIDNPLNPLTGSRQLVSVSLAGLGGSEEFWLAELSNTIYRPIWRPAFGDFVFSQRVDFGYGDTFDGETFPLFRRFFPGGINSVRGFKSRELGPKDANGNEFGGNKELVANFELIFPIFSAMGLKGVTFYDIGNAFDDDENIEFADLRQAVGWGVRWNSPLGPIRVEIGYPLERKEGEDSVVTLFSFGAPL